MRGLRGIALGGIAALVASGILGTAPVARAAAGSVEGIPAFDHVFVIVLENESATVTWGRPGTYLNGLLSQGAFASQYYGVSHLSADNYMAMTSGQMPTPFFNADCLDWGKCETWEQSRPDGGVSVVNQIDAVQGKTWKAYMDGMVTPCKHPPQDPPVAPNPSFASVFSPDPNQAGYATRHDPFVYYPPVVNDQTYCNAHVVDYSNLVVDTYSPSPTPGFSSSPGPDLSTLKSTPNYVFITPDTCHDGHDGTCTADPGQPGGPDGADLWMRGNVPTILASPAFTTPGMSSLLFITTDEAANTDVTGCTTGPLTTATTPGTCASGVPPAGVDGGGLIGLLAIGSNAGQLAGAGPHIVPGSATATPYDHNSLLRTVEDGLGLGPLSPPSGSTVVFQDAAGHLNGAGSPLEHAMASLFSG